MKLIITHADAASRIVLDIAVAGKHVGELEPGKTVTVEGPQVAISHGRTLDDDNNHETN
jgi:hypothetical protein